MVISRKELQSSRRNDRPFVLGVPKTTLSFCDLLEGLTKFRKFSTPSYSLVQQKDTDQYQQRKKVQRPS